MNIIFISFEENFNYKNFLAGRDQLPHSIYFFDDINYILRLNFFTNGFNMFFFCCDEVTEIVEKSIPLLKKYIRNGKIIIACKQYSYTQVRRAFLSGADDYLIVQDFPDIESYIRDYNDHEYGAPNTDVGMDKEWEADYLLKERLFAGLIDKTLTHERDYNKWIKDLHFNEYSDFVVMIAKVDTNCANAESENYNDFIDVHNEILYQYLDEFSNIYIPFTRTVFLKQLDSVCILCSWRNNEDFLKKHRLIFIQFFEDVAKRFYEHTTYSFTMGISSIYNDIRLTKEAYHQAKKAVNSRFYSGCRQVYFYNFHNSTDSIEGFDVSKVEIELEAIMSYRNLDLLLKQCAGFCQNLKTYHLSYSAVTAYFLAILNKLVFSAGRYGFTVLTEMNETAEIMEIMKRLPTYDLLMEYFLSYINSKITKPANAAGCVSAAIEQAIAIIDNNYSSDINLKSVANQVHLNANYFSELFKKEIGMNFINYLTNLRMEMAKKMLLKTNKSVYQIGEEVGYSEPVSFNRIFKRKFGMTPSQFRKQSQD